MSKDHDHDYQPSDISLRVKAVESLLVEKGLIDREAIDKLVDAYENKIGPHNGARVVARAWCDPEFKKRLLADGTKAIAELGYLASLCRIIGIGNSVVPRDHGFSFEKAVDALNAPFEFCRDCQSVISHSKLENTFIFCDDAPVVSPG
jgi:hypothetical protein